MKIFLSRTISLYLRYDVILERENKFLGLYRCHSFRHTSAQIDKSKLLHHTDKPLKRSSSYQLPSIPLRCIPKWNRHTSHHYSAWKFILLTHSCPSWAAFFPVWTLNEINLTLAPSKIVISYSTILFALTYLYSFPSWQKPFLLAHISHLTPVKRTFFLSCLRICHGYRRILYVSWQLCPLSRFPEVLKILTIVCQKVASIYFTTAWRIPYSRYLSFYHLGSPTSSTTLGSLVSPPRFHSSRPYTALLFDPLSHEAVTIIPTDRQLPFSVRGLYQNSSNLISA